MPERPEDYELKRLLFSQLTVRTAGGETSYLEGVLRHPGQSDIHFTPWMYYVAAWGRRTGKTIAAAAEVAWELCKPGSKVWIVAPSYDLTDRVFEYVWRWVVQEKILDKILGQPVVETKGFSKKGARYIRLRSGAMVECRSGESDSNIGDQTDLVVIDEAARLAEIVWTQDVQPTTIDRHGRTIFISTPRGRNWFYDYWRRKDHKSTRDKGWRGSRFATWENPFVDPAWVRSVEEETPPDVFRREYGASFEHFTGLIYPDYRDALHDFSRAGAGGHLYDPSEIELPLDRMTIYYGGDVGSEHPTAWLWAAVGRVDFGDFIGHDEDLWIFREYLGEGRVPHPEHAKAIAALSAGLRIWDGYISPDAARTHRITGDPLKDRSIKDIYDEHGIVCRVANNDFDYGVAVVRSYLAATLQAAPAHGRLFISMACPKLRQGIVNYVWTEPQRRTGYERDSPERPRKYKDDSVDALRYLLVAEPRPLPAGFRFDDEPEDLGTDAQRYGYPVKPKNRRRPGMGPRIMGLTK